MYRLFFILLMSALLNADEVVWTGNVNSDGTPSEAVRLNLKDTYQIKVSGFINLGKWVQQREKLANDACYEFNPEAATEQIISIKNSLDIAVCDGKYHPDHVYISKPFIAQQNRVHFWIFDQDYDDNHGELKVEIIQVK